MKETSKDMPALNMDATANMAPPHPAVFEAERLHRELAEERTKTEALSRRCIRLGQALDAALEAEENRTERDMFDIINCNYERRKAAAAAEKRRRVAKRKAVAGIKKACRRNAVALTVSAVLGFTAALLGFAGFIPAIVATVIGGIFALAFGWALNDCVYLLGRCGK